MKGMDVYNEFPELVGGLRRSSCIGTGAFSRVFIGIDQKTNQKYALKFVSRGLFSDRYLVREFEREVRIHENLDHQHVAKLYKTIYTEKYIVLVEEYCSRGSLFDLLAYDGPLPQYEVLRIATQLLSALIYLHSKNVSHRDIKPENIVFDRNMTPKLIDFGFCADNANNLTKTKCGTLYYLSPEMLTNVEYDSKAADVWALGMTLYIAATGCIPWGEGSPLNIFHQIMNWKCVVPNCFDSVCKDLFEGMLVHEVDNRMTAEQAYYLINNHSFIKRQAATISRKTLIQNYLNDSEKKSSSSPPTHRHKIIIRPQKSSICSSRIRYVL